MKYRTGRITSGVSVVVIGLVALLANLTSIDWINGLSRLWPLILIGYGLEYFWSGRKGERTSFDIVGVIIVVLSIGFVFGTVFSDSGGFTVFGERYTFEDDPIVFEESGISSFVAEGENGNITVQPSGDGNITILPVYRIMGNNRDRALERKNDISLDVQMDGDRLVATVKHPRSIGFNLGSDKVDLTVFVPRHINVGGETANGSIKVTSMEDVGRLKTTNGRITVTNSQGEAEIRATNGRIEVVDFIGGLEVRSTNGSVKVEGELRGDWQISTTNGSVRATVPENGSYDYDFSTANGGIRVPDPPFTGRRSRNRYEGRINEGEHKLDIRTTNGAIEVSLTN